MVNIISGITQTAPAWNEIRISPAFMSDLTHANSKIPTPKGEIIISWKKENNKTKLTLTLPEEIVAVIDIAEIAQTISQGGTYNFTF